MAKGNFGERLKREREMREVSLNELTKATRISERFLEALENEQWDRLPGGVFGRGFIRTIARYLGLDEESLLAEYDLARSDQAQPATPKPEERIPSPPKWMPFVALLGIAAIVAGLFYAGLYAWRRYIAHRYNRQSSVSLTLAQPNTSTNANIPVSSTGTASDPLSSPSLPSPTSDTSASAAPLRLSVSTSAATRVRILADDKLLLDTELPAGENRRFSAQDHFEITAGDSSAVLLELNGRVMRPLGVPGSSGTMVLSEKDLRQASGGTSQP